MVFYASQSFVTGLMYSQVDPLGSLRRLSRWSSVRSFASLGGSVTCRRQPDLQSLTSLATLVRLVPSDLRSSVTGFLSAQPVPSALRASVTCRRQPDLQSLLHIENDDQSQEKIDRRDNHSDAVFESCHL